MKKMTKKSIIISTGNALVIALLILTALAVVLTNVYSYQLNKETSDRYELTRYANMFMSGSSYLTRQVRAYSATGEQRYYDAYWTEVNDTKSRNTGITMLKRIGITDEEQKMVNEMYAISNDLIPLEAEAMELASSGRNQEAIDIVYGTYYSESIARILELRDQFLSALDERTSYDIAVTTRKCHVLNVLTWIMVALTIILQMFQRRALHHLSYRDLLTKGLNYSFFQEKMRDEAGVSGPGHVVSADIRGFSNINDTCGYNVGDQVIREMGRILDDSLNPGELCAHVSGDRFVLFLHNNTLEDLIARIIVLHSKLSGISEQLDIPHIQPLFGIREVPNTLHPGGAYNDANLAKQILKNNDTTDEFYFVYTDEVRQKLMDDKLFEEEFEEAIAKKQFEVWYQPCFSPTTGTMVSAAALVRWRRADGSLVYPKDFIPVFERTGMIAELDEYIFNLVCEQQRKWMEEDLDIVPISVNISCSSLNYSGMAERYIKIVTSNRIPISYIELEFSESGVYADQEIENSIRLFKSRGFRILVEGFGGGHTSLCTLTKDYFDGIKIDKDIVDTIGTLKGDSIIGSLIQLAHRYNIAVTAVGVETEAQAKYLIAISCDVIQGFYYSHPLPTEEFAGLIKD